MDTEEIHMAGYLEKLPMNKKRYSKVHLLLFIPYIYSKWKYICEKFTKFCSIPSTYTNFHLNSTVFCTLAIGFTAKELAKTIFQNITREIIIFWSELIS